MAADIELTFEADSSDARKSFLNFEKQILSSTENIAKGFNDLSIQEFGGKLDAEFSKSLKSSEDYAERLRALAPQVKKLYKDLVSGSFDESDFNRRFNLLPDSVRQAVIDVQDLGKGFDGFNQKLTTVADKVEDAAQKIERGFSDVSIKQFADHIGAELSKTEKGTEAYKDKLRSLKPEIEKLYKDLLGGSFDQKDFDRRLKLLPDSIQDAVRDVNKLGTGFDGLNPKADKSSLSISQVAKNLGFATESAAGLSAALPVVGAVIAGVTAAVVAGSVAIFNIAKSAAEYGAEIGKAADQTGLSVEAISSLKYAAEQSGTSFDTVTDAISEYAQTIGDAKTGSDEAREKLVRLFGNDWKNKTKDLESSFESVLKKIVALPDPIERAKAANDAFGESGDKLLPFIKSFNGDIGSLIEKAKTLGVTLSDEDVQASKNFNRAMSTIDSQVKKVALTFAGEFIPELVGGMRDVSRGLSDNSGAWKRWGREIAEVISLVRKLGAYFTSGEGQYVIYGLQVATQAATGGNPSAIIPPVVTPQVPIYDDGTAVPLSDKPKKEPKTSGYLRDVKGGENAAKKLLDEKIKGVDLDIDKANIGYDTTKQKLEDTLKAQVITLDDYKNDIFENIASTQGKLNAFFEQQKSLAYQRFSGVEQNNALKEIEKKQLEAEKKFDKDAEDSALNIRDLRIKTKEEEVKSLIELSESATKKQIANFEKEVSEEKKSEEELLRYKEDKAEFDLNYRKEKAQDYRNFIYKTLEEESKMRRGVSLQQMLDENADYTKAKDEAAKADYEYETKKTENLAAQTKRRKEITDSFEKEQRNFQVEAGRRDLERNLETSRQLIGIGQDRLINIKAFYDAEIALIDYNKEKTLEALEKEREERVKKYAGLKDEKELVEKINELYERRKQLVEGDAENQKKQTKQDRVNEQENAVSNQYGGGMFGDLMGRLDVYKDPTIDMAEKTDLAVQSMTKSWDFAKGAIGMSIDGIIGSTQQMLQQFIMTGKLSGAAFKQMAAGIISGLVVQAGVKALFELAEGYAALANPITAPLAPFHFAAAKTYGLVAGVAAAAAVTLAATSSGTGGKNDNAQVLSSSNSTRAASSTIDDEKSRALVEERYRAQEQATNDRNRLIDSNDRFVSAVGRFEKAAAEGFKLSGKLGFKEEDVFEMVERGAKESYNRNGFMRGIFKNGGNDTGSPYD